jgi:hypothetical protein
VELDSADYSICVGYFLAELLCGCMAACYGEDLDGELNRLGLG